MRVVLVIAIVGCGHAAPPSKPAQPPAVATSPLGGFDRADLVVMHDGRVVAYAAGEKLLELGSLAVGKPGDYVEGEWADHGHLFAVAADRDVVMITRDALVHLPVPPPDKLVAPKPEKYDEGLEAGGGDGELAVARGRALWSRCAWGYPYDGFQCEVWVHAELWPEPGIRDESARLQPQAWRWPDAAPPSYTASKGDHAVTCHAPGAAKVVIEASDEDLVGDAVWVSTAPPQLLVTYGRLGLNDLVVTSWTLHDGCAAQPIAHGRTADPGPGELWLATDEDQHRELRRGARVLGRLDDGRVAFRPR